MIATSVKTRFAPSPTGHLHLGNLRTALFNVLLARGTSGCFLLRIEDTDAQRSTAEFTNDLMEDLRWLGLDWQEGPGIDAGHGPYLQSERAPIYDEFYHRLEAADLAYPCFCKDSALKLARKAQLASGQPPRYAGTCARLSAEERERHRQQGLQPTLRFRVPAGQRIEFNDLVRGPQSFDSADIGDFVIRRSDGTPAFFFCNAVDDALMGVTHVLRGEDHISNTPRQILLLEAMNLPVPAYGHISLIMDGDGGPLSKRSGALSLRALRASGYLPLALLNHLARLGHVCTSDALMDLDMLARDFDIHRLGRSPARHDPVQLDHWQRLAVNAAGADVLRQWVPADAGLTPSEIDALIEAVRDNVQFPCDMEAWVRRLEADFPELDSAGQARLMLAGAPFFSAALEALDMQPDGFQAFARDVGARTGCKGKALYLPLRLALSGADHGPEMHRLWEFLGIDRIRRRLERARQLC